MQAGTAPRAVAAAAHSSGGGSSTAADAPVSDAGGDSAAAQLAGPLARKRRMSGGRASNGSTASSGSGDYRDAAGAPSSSSYASSGLAAPAGPAADDGQRPLFVVSRLPLWAGVTCCNAPPGQLKSSAARPSPCPWLRHLPLRLHASPLQDPLSAVLDPAMQAWHPLAAAGPLAGGDPAAKGPAAGVAGSAGDAPQPLLRRALSLESGLEVAAKQEALEAVLERISLSPEAPEDSHDVDAGAPSHGLVPGVEHCAA